VLVVEVEVVVTVVVDVAVDVVVGATVVVGESHGHPEGARPAIAALRQTSESVAVVGSVPFGAHTQAGNGSHVAMPAATPRIARQSVAVGASPFVWGCEQSPTAALAGNDQSTTQIATIQPHPLAFSSRCISRHFPPPVRSGA